MKAHANNTLNPHPGSRLVMAVVAMTFSCCGAALGAADWDGAKVTKTDLLAGETKHGKFAYSFASVIVVDGQERGKYEMVPAGPAFRSDGVLEFLAADQTSLYRIEVRDL